MHIFIDFWKLETENSFCIFSIFFTNWVLRTIFVFLSILCCQTNFLVSKIENNFWKQKIRGKTNYQIYPKLSKEVQNLAYC